jgi:UDP-N-acetylmuramoyl-tripeptide--D-alanyl-D-alanine ligase
MESMQLEEIMEAVQGTLVQGVHSNIRITGVSIDSRKVRQGDLFFAFHGKRVDGHDYLEQAFEQGAVGAVISRPVAVQTEATLIMVSDPLKALQDLARCYRNLYKIRVVAVTGSTGKTTTKDLVAGVLGKRFKVLKTTGNYNNEIGLPLTLLQLNSSHQVAVLEMAMRGPGEITLLCEISRPEVGVITNIGESHMELLGSQKAIALAKGELLNFLPADGCAVLHAQDPWQVKLAEKVSGEVILYGAGDGCQISASQVVVHDLQGNINWKFSFTVDHSKTAPLRSKLNLISSYICLFMNTICNYRNPGTFFDLMHCPVIDIDHCITGSLLCSLFPQAIKEQHLSSQIFI